MGFAGRKEGIIAYATVLLQKSLMHGNVTRFQLKRLSNSLHLYGRCENVERLYLQT
jgi:hypothetical protein